MLKKNFLYLSIILVVLLGVFVFYYAIKDNIVFMMITGIEKSEQSRINAHFYDDESISIKDVLVRVYYIVPENSKIEFDNWHEVLSAAMQKAGAFFELQFGYSMNMDFTIYLQPILVAQPASYFIDLVEQDYIEEIAVPHSSSMAIKAVTDAVKNGLEAQEQWDISVSRINNSYIVNLFVLALNLDDLKTGNMKVFGLNDEGNNSLIFSKGFTDKRFKNFYESIVGHEIGHALGIPRFYSYTSDEVQTSGMMGGGLVRKLKDNYLNQAIKEKMITY